MSWFEREPARLQLELDALTNAGMLFTVDEDERAQGRIVINVTRSIEGAEHIFRVEYPDQFPYFAFAAFAPDSLPLSRHINRYARNLCLLADVQQTWTDTDTAAELLTTQLDRLVAANRDPASAADLEAHDAELITGHLDYLPNTVLFTIGSDIPKHVDRGYLDVVAHTVNDATFRGAMVAVLDGEKTVLSELPKKFVERYQTAKKFGARWIRLSTPPGANAPDRILDEAIRLWPELKRPAYSGGPDIVALYVPEQTGYQTEGYAWIPVVRHKVRQGRQIGLRTYLCRPNRADLTDVQARNPRLRPLQDTTVLAVGLGALGSTIAWQLARSGVGELRLIDQDVVETGNTPRWLLGVPAVGFSKAAAIAQHLQQSFPYLSIDRSHVHHFAIGNHKLGPVGNEPFYKSLDGVDLIVDGSAERSVNHYLSTQAREKNVPYLWATATPGARGGVVGRTIPDRNTGCWACFQYALDDETIAAPPQEDDGLVQPLGCALPTFTGAGLDLDEISNQAARLAVSTLLRGSSGHQDVDWDVAVCSLWDSAADRFTVPTWTTYNLPRDARCRCN